ncbi:MAG: cob(I)yrinic acid a,c-diamide adenosyltransferase [Chloroflexi bacterium]|nr:cob(I)yrinic acid a,c-diamide adenosyltransferase [Chloroflexota bacterium]
MSPVYTRTGDNGTTGLLGEGRLPKFHPRLETLGTIDEASAALGLARSLCKAEKIAPILLEIQRDLYSIMAEVAATPENAARFRSLDSGRVQWLESQAEAVSAALPPLTEFILPGDSPGGAALSLARTIVRRAERRAAALLAGGEIENQVLLQYLNRLSSLCFALELLENQQAGQKTSRAKKEKSDADTQRTSAGKRG